MKSLRYRLCGRPAKLDDCLDRARRTRPSAVALALTVEEVVHELQILRQFVASFEWRFADRRVICSVLCGSLRRGRGRAGAAEALAKANGKLEILLKKLQQSGINCEGSGRRFALSRHRPSPEKPAVRSPGA